MTDINDTENFKCVYIGPIQWMNAGKGNYDVNNNNNNDDGSCFFTEDEIWRKCTTLKTVNHDEVPDSSSLPSTASSEGDPCIEQLIIYNRSSDDEERHYADLSSNYGQYPRQKSKYPFNPYYYNNHYQQQGSRLEFQSSLEPCDMKKSYSSKSSNNNNGPESLVKISYQQLEDADATLSITNEQRRKPVKLERARSTNPMSIDWVFLEKFKCPKSDRDKDGEKRERANVVGLAKMNGKKIVYKFSKMTNNCVYWEYNVYQGIKNHLPSLKCHFAEIYNVIKLPLKVSHMSLSI